MTSIGTRIPQECHFSDKHLEAKTRGQSDLGAKASTVANVTQHSASVIAGAAGTLAPPKSASILVGVVAERVEKASPVGDVIAGGRVVSKFVEGDPNGGMRILATEGVEKGAVATATVVGAAAGGPFGELTGPVAGAATYFGVNTDAVQVPLQAAWDRFGNMYKEWEAKMQYSAGQAMQGCDAGCEL